MASRKQRAWNVPGFGLPLRWPEMQSRRWQPMVQSDENILLASALDCTENPYVSKDPRPALSIIIRFGDLHVLTVNTAIPDASLR